MARKYQLGKTVERIIRFGSIGKIEYRALDSKITCHPKMLYLDAFLDDKSSSLVPVYLLPVFKF